MDQVSSPLNSTPEEIIRELHALTQLVNQGSVAEQSRASARILVRPLLTLTDDQRTRSFDTTRGNTLDAQANIAYLVGQDLGDQIRV